VHAERLAFAHAGTDQQLVQLGERVVHPTAVAQERQRLLDRPTWTLDLCRTPAAAASRLNRLLTVSGRNG
jgi:hypothetical protein